jgi:hypothetical protein
MCITTGCVFDVDSEKQASWMKYTAKNRLIGSNVARKTGFFDEGAAVSQFLSISRVAVQSIWMVNKVLENLDQDFKA